MRKVTTINLNGRAYQLEEQAYDQLQTYLHRAEVTLTKDPDKTEVLSDLEQAIADKCDRVLQNGKNVVTTEHISEILSQMGEVEGEDQQNAEAPANEPRKLKRLFVIREGAMFMGVCNGIGAYLGIEPNLVRLAFVLLTIFTGGFWVIVYLLLGLLLPSAKSETELAEAHGKSITAQAIVARAKERAPGPEALQRVVDILVIILRLIARLISIAAAVVFGVLTAAWLWVVWLLVLGRLHLYDQLRPLNGWHEWLIITALYLLPALPLLLVARLFNRVASNRSQTRVSTISEGSVAVLWGLAVISLLGFGTAYAQNVRDYVNSHQGHISIGNSRVCVDRSTCDPGMQKPQVYYNLQMRQPELIRDPTKPTPIN